MEDTADRQSAISTIKSSANDLITKVKAMEGEEQTEEDKIKIDGMFGMQIAASFQFTWKVDID